MLEPHLRAGQQSPVVVQPPPSVAPPPIQVKTGAESLAEQLQTMQLFAKMAETMGFVRPSYAAPAGVGVGAPAPAPQAIPIAPALDPLSGLIRDLKKVEEMKATLKTAFGFVDPRDEPDEPEEPAPKTPPEADVPYDTYTIPLTSQYNGGVDMKGIKPKPGKKMTIIDHVKGWAEQNPMATLTFGSKAFEIIDKSTMGAVVKAIGERGAVGLGAMPPVAPEPPVPTPPQISAAPPLATPPQHSMSNGVDRHVVQVPADLTSYVPPA
jgi:hypothetical protein